MAGLREAKRTDVLWRGLYGVEHDGAEYVVEVDFFDFRERVRLYRDGLLVEERTSPAVFEMESGARIEASMALFGMKRAHFVDVGGTERELEPLSGTAEARRRVFGDKHPAASATIAALSWTVLVVALVTQVPNAVNGLANAAAALGLPLDLALPSFAFPAWLDVLLSVLGLAAALDRGLRMVHNPLLDD